MRKFLKILELKLYKMKEMIIQFFEDLASELLIFVLRQAG